MLQNKIVQENLPKDNPGKITTRWACLKINGKTYNVAYLYSPTAGRWFVSKVTPKRKDG